jgi:hypothetical protein
LADVEDFYAQCDPGELRFGVAHLDPFLVPGEPPCD